MDSSLEEMKASREKVISKMKAHQEEMKAIREV
jgi:hypothetical protein